MKKIVDIGDSESKQKNRSNIFFSLKNSSKSIPTRYLYDELGSKLFEQICNTEEYYLTRVEQYLLETNASEIVKLSNPTDIFEFGSGSSKKTTLLIGEQFENNPNISYSSLDISRKALKMTFEQVKKINNKIQINLFKGDFLSDLKKVQLINTPRLFLFLGSTLGNFDDKIALAFLTGLRKVMKKKDYFLLGIDMLKEESIITSAYNDSKGITKRFNKNILQVVNKKYKLKFNKNNFEHQAYFNSRKSQIEMYLKSKKEHKIQLPDNSSIQINSGEKILTEISRKFSFKVIQSLLKKSDLKIEKKFQDKKKYYTLMLIRRL